MTSPRGQTHHVCAPAGASRLSHRAWIPTASAWPAISRAPRESPRRLAPGHDRRLRLRLAPLPPSRAPGDRPGVDSLHADHSIGSAASPESGSVSACRVFAPPDDHALGVSAGRIRRRPPPLHVADHGLGERHQLAGEEGVGTTSWSAGHEGGRTPARQPPHPRPRRPPRSERCRPPAAKEGHRPTHRVDGAVSTPPPTMVSSTRLAGVARRRRRSASVTGRAVRPRIRRRNPTPPGSRVDPTRIVGTSSPMPRLNAKVIALDAQWRGR